MQKEYFFEAKELEPQDFEQFEEEYGVNAEYHNEDTIKLEGPAIETKRVIYGEEINETQVRQLLGKQYTTETLPEPEEQIKEPIPATDGGIPSEFPDQEHYNQLGEDGYTQARQEFFEQDINDILE